MFCHRKCCMYGTLGVVVTVVFLGWLGYFGRCVELQRERDNQCNLMNLPVCDICSRCNSTAVCPEINMRQFCGVDCSESEKKVQDFGCPVQRDTWVGLGMMIMLAVVFGTATMWYICKEGFQTLTGTQDDK